MENKPIVGWASEEMGQVDLGDKRLNERLISICDRFSESPECPINQACEDWAETKAAYRFFDNPDVDSNVILKPHCLKTVVRAKSHKTILAIQDSSYFIYTSHHKTEGLGEISLKKGKNIEKIYSNGLIMHACLGVTTDGLPLGLLDQKIFARKLRSTERRRLAEVTPIEEKESYRWLESLKNTKEIIGGTQVVTVCDREADMYDLFKLSHTLESPVLVRANVDRDINKKSRYAEKDVVKLWKFMRDRQSSGTLIVDITERKASRHVKARKARKAILTVKFGAFVLNPPRNNIKHRTSVLPDLTLNAIYAYEADPAPESEEKVEWMLLTNLPVSDFNEACEKIKWYCLRWRIEMYFKVLKSGFNVEDCRLAKADRLIRYLTVMSIVAWRLFNITLIARTDPDKSCAEYLSEIEWKVLYQKFNKKIPLPHIVPNIRDVVIWIARLGVSLARKSDGMPGSITLWRGWKRLIDLTDGWELSLTTQRCG